MKMITMMGFLLMIMTSLCLTSVQPSTATCTCAQIQYKTDCLQAIATINGTSISCQWVTYVNVTGTHARGACIIPRPRVNTQISPAKTYCSQIPITNCSQTLGCANTDGRTCTPFSGCSAYIRTSDSLCQAISTQCTSDGIQCMTKEACKTYSVSLCANQSSSGTGKCKVVNSTCVDQDCSDLVQQQICIAYSGCFWNGLTCTNNLSSCALTLGSQTTCPNLIGSDGPCKYISGAKCTNKTCADAPPTISTNANCISFMPSCLFTTGKGCTTQLLTCSTYLQSNICSGYIGSDGPCVIDTLNINCRAQLCTDAPITTTTDTACNTFKLGCLTTGQGCAQFRSQCSGYSGTTTTCPNYIGSDGYCKGSSTTIATACAAKICTDNTTATTNSACDQFQIGCITNGRGCVSSLPLCSKYTYSYNSPCDGLIGSDGNCSSGSGVNCVARSCSAATGDIRTNTVCQAYSPICMTNGTSCVAFTGTCESQPTMLQCQGSSMCLSTNVCKDNRTCTSYETQTICSLNKAGPYGYLRPCIWSSTTSACNDVLCTSLTGNAYLTDSACNSALIGCVYSGIPSGGCIEPTAGCSAFYGTNSGSSLCATAMKGTCWGIFATISPCVVRTCNLYSGTTPTIDQICQIFLVGCVSDGANSCITPTICQGYFGSALRCKGIISNIDKGPISRNLCWPNVSGTQTSGACRVMACSDIIIGLTPFAAVASSACSSVNPNCTTSFNSGSGNQCTAIVAACSSYNASFNNCKTAITTTTGQTCSKYAKLCGYQAPQACASYTVVGTDTITNQVYCQGVSVDGTVLCGYTTGTNCVALSFVTACTGFAVAGATATTNFAYCQKMKASGTTQCGYTTGSTTCSTVACSQVTPTSAADCTGIVGTTCAYSFSITASCIAVVATCGYIVPTGLTKQSAKLAWCNAIRDATATAGCGYSSGTTCSAAKACTDLNTNSYIGTLTQGVCNTYIVAPACAFSGFSCQPKTGTLPACTTHVFPTGVTLTNQQKFQFCNALSEDATKFCSWDGTAANCISATGLVYTAYTVTSGAANILANQAYCSLLKDKDGVVCSYDGTGAQGTCGLGALTKAAGPPETGCVSYVTVVSGTANDVANQLYCTRLSETDGSALKRCAYSTGGTTCTSQSATACTDASYTPVAVATTEAQRLQICQSEGCGFAFTGTSATSTAVCLAAKACTDLSGGITSLAQCENYIPGGICGFNSVLGSCYILATACGSLNQNSLAKCAGFIDSVTATQTCGILSAGAAACKVRACGDVTNAASADDCSGYLSSCIYDGTGTCKAKGACTSYTYLSTATTTVAATYCQALVNASGLPCTNDLTASSTACVDKSSALGCVSATAAIKPLDCSTWGTQCVVDTTNACAYQACSEITNATSNASCPAQCIWNGTTGCVLPTVACSIFTGTDATCRNFTGNNIQCYQSNAAATATTPCADLSSCTLNTTATSDAQCETFWPSPKGQPKNTRCQWNGIIGCVAGETLTCSQFIGTIESCPKFTGAIDAPCKGTSIQLAPCSPKSCSDAPNNLTSDQDCNIFRNGCLTTGKGCQYPPLIGNAGCQTYQNYLSCNVSKLGGTGNNTYNTCVWTAQCLTRPSSCTSITIPSVCVTIIVDKTMQNPLGTCSWYINNLGVGGCRPTTCADLPATITTDASCSALISSCTTNGEGCVIKGSCTSYLNKLTCTSAATTDVISRCTWVLGSGCRMQQCQDNNFTTDEACNINGLKMCRTTGVTCIAAYNLSCDKLTYSEICLKDGNNFPCMWIDNICYQYMGCSSIARTTHAQCQVINTGSTIPQCTSDGVRCQALDSCANYKQTKISCVIGNDGSTCGMLPAGSNGNIIDLCQKFGACADAKGKTNEICKAYGQDCISNGASCQLPSTCNSYTQTACANIGLDGTCFWSAQMNICRTQQCSDSKTNNTTDAGCALFPAPYINTCTTNGTSCISRSICALYMIQTSCVLGIDGSCFWVASSGICRVKQCTDLISTTTVGCQNQIVSQPASTSIIGTTLIKYLACVSNGTMCIPKANCATYINQVSCSGENGLDGTCIFKQINFSTPTIGTCKVVQTCADIGADSSFCSLYYDRCQLYTTIFGNITISQCIPHDCKSKSNGSTCQPIPSWDKTSYTLCLPVSQTNSTCQIGDGEGLNESTCFNSSAKTYTWNDTKRACIYCGATSTVNTSIVDTNNTSHDLMIRSTYLILGVIIANY